MNTIVEKLLLSFFYFSQFFFYFYPFCALQKFINLQMSSSVATKLKQKSPTHANQLSNYLFICCDDNNIERSHYNLFGPYPSSFNKNTNSMKQIKGNNEEKHQIQTKKKYLSPNTKNSHNKIHIKEEQDKLRQYAKSLQLQKQQIDEIQSPTKRLYTKLPSKKNQISAISMKKIDNTFRPTLRKNQTIPDNNGSQTFFNANIHSQKTLKAIRGTKNNKKIQNKFQYQNIVDHFIGKNNTLCDFNNNQNQRQNTASFNQQLNDSLCNHQSFSKIGFSPPARISQKYQISKLTKISSYTNKLNQNLSKSPVNKNSNSDILIKHNKIPLTFIQLENNKDKINLQLLKQSIHDFKKLQQEEAKFTFRQEFTQNHLIITASEDENNKNFDNFINPSQKTITQNKEYKKQLRKISSKQMLKTLIDCRNQLGVVKQSVISEMSDENKDLQQSFYQRTNNKIASNKNSYTKKFNPQQENKINTSCDPSYSPSLVFQSYKASPPRYLIKKLSSATVNSILQPIRDSEIKQKVQQSVVMHNFFNIAPQYQQQIQ